MPRGARNPSEVLASVLHVAKQELGLGAASAGAFTQTVIRGDERAAKLGKFLRDHLPQRFSVAKGEVIDYADNRSSQLDLLIYDSHTCAPVIRGEENLLIPAEALYAVIEVKTTLTGYELVKCYTAARLLRRLRPFKRWFVPARTGGSPADKNPRCLYTVFSYTSDLSEENWVSKEYDRALHAAFCQDATLDAIDRILVLSLGFISPGQAKGKQEDEDAQSVFLDFYLYLVNFLAREVKRRDPIDWQLYGARTSPGWVQLA